MKCMIKQDLVWNLLDYDGLLSLTVTIQDCGINNVYVLCHILLSMKINVSLPIKINIYTLCIY